MIKEKNVRDFAKLVLAIIILIVFLSLQPSQAMCEIRGLRYDGGMCIGVSYCGCSLIGNWQTCEEQRINTPDCDLYGKEWR